MSLLGRLFLHPSPTSSDTPRILASSTSHFVDLEQLCEKWTTNTVRLQKPISTQETTKLEDELRRIVCERMPYHLHLCWGVAKENVLWLLRSVCAEVAGPRSGSMTVAELVQLAWYRTLLEYGLKYSGKVKFPLAPMEAVADGADSRQAKKWFEETFFVCLLGHCVPTGKKLAPGGTETLRDLREDVCRMESGTMAVPDVLPAPPDDGRRVAEVMFCRQLYGIAKELLHLVTNGTVGVDPLSRRTGPVSHPSAVAASGGDTKEHGSFSNECRSGPAGEAAATAGSYGESTSEEAYPTEAVATRGASNQQSPTTGNRWLFFCGGDASEGRTPTLEFGAVVGQVQRFYHQHGMESHAEAAKVVVGQWVKNFDSFSLLLDDPPALDVPESGPADVLLPESCYGALFDELEYKYLYE